MNNKMGNKVAALANWAMDEAQKHRTKGEEEKGFELDVWASKLLDAVDEVYKVVENAKKTN